MSANPRYRRPKDKFAIYTAGAAFLVASLVVVVRLLTSERPAGQAWLVVMPFALAAVAWVFLRRQGKGDELPCTVHQYTVQAPAGRQIPRGRALADKLEARGYQLELVNLDEAGRSLPTPPGESSTLADGTLRLRDRRAGVQVGEVVIHVGPLPDGRVTVRVEASDSGPGLYDEMAQFILVDLASQIEGLELVATSEGPVERRPASTMGEGLPARPFGLALFPQKRR